MAPSGEADDVRARRAGVDDEAGERDVVHGVRLFGHRRVDAARGDEGVDEVEVGRGRTVELGDAAVRVEGDGGLGIVRRGERDEPRLVVPLAKLVEVHRPFVECLEAAEAGGGSAGPAQACRAGAGVVCLGVMALRQLDAPRTGEPRERCPTCEVIRVEGFCRWCHEAGGRQYARRGSRAGPDECAPARYPLTRAPGRRRSTSCRRCAGDAHADIAQARRKKHLAMRFAPHPELDDHLRRRRGRADRRAGEGLTRGPLRAAVGGVAEVTHAWTDCPAVGTDMAE